MKKKQSKAEQLSEYRAKMKARDFTFYLAFLVNGQEVEKFIIPKSGDYAEAILKFKEKHGDVPHALKESHSDHG